MNIYDRIINILLEARVEDYLDRLDERSEQSKRNKQKKNEVVAKRRDPEEGPQGQNTPDEQEDENFNNARRGRQSMASTPQSQLARGRGNERRHGRDAYDVAYAAKRKRASQAFMKKLYKP